LHEAARISHEGLRLIERQGGPLPASAANLYARLSLLHYEWNDLDGALQHARRAQAISRAGDYRTLSIAISDVIAQILAAQGDQEGAQTALAETDALVQRTGDPELALLFAARRLRFQAATGAPVGEQLRAGDLAWAHKRGLSPDDEPTVEYEMEYVALARMLLGSTDRRPAGLRLLDRLVQVEEASGGTGMIIGILAVQAVGLAAQGAGARAFAALERALLLAEPEGYIRTFVDEGPPMQALLRAAATRGIAPAYVETLLAHFALNREPPPARAAGEPLTPREQEVLHLLADGASNQAIAAALSVTLGTVKRHANSLYGKLGVGSRTQAVARARELHLL
jgi:LuxR family maltose regulon positive regulatory protein